MSQKDSSSKQKIVPSGRRTRARIPAVAPPQAEAPKAPPAEQPANGGEGETQDWKSRVMAGYKGKSPKATHTLLAKIAGDKAAVEVGDRHKEQAIRDAMIPFVDRMFDAFQNCAYEINRHAAGSDLELNWIRPHMQKETIGGWRNKQQEVIEVLSGRLSTRLWTMVVRGTAQHISIHILPQDRLISFGTNQNDFNVYLVMQPLIEGLGVKWTIHGKELSIDKYSDIYRELFEALIRHARGKANSGETFNVKLVGIEPIKKDVKVDLDDVQRQYQDAFFEDMRKRAQSSTSDLHASPMAKRNFPGGDRPGQPPYNSGQFPGIADQSAGRAQVKPPQVPYQPPPVPPGYMPSANSWHGQQTAPAPNTVPPGQKPGYPQQSSQQQPPQQQPPQHSQQQQPNYPPAPPPGGYPPAPQMPPQNMQQQGMSQPMPQVAPGMPYGQPPMPAQQQQQHPPQPQYLPQQHQHPQQQMPQHQHPHAPQQPQQPLAPGQQANQNVSFPVALSMLLPTLDRELEVVAKAGMDAFSQRDLVRADAALKFSGRLSEFRALALELLDYYKRK